MSKQFPNSPAELPIPHISLLAVGDRIHQQQPKKVLNITEAGVSFSSANLIQNRVMALSQGSAGSSG
ncbi:unnamed protein product [Linum trigynum]|uniref:Uncharacterized protein n=1 Tax=Linum trigynum TaxID=586398 RepID=A0AAV2F0A0_9ROSI